MEEEFKKIDTEENGWEKHYELLTQKSRKHSAKVGDLAANKDLNRYLDVLPYDKTRVKLSRVLENDYINANLVTVPKAARQYILTQGPLPETSSHFWLMVWEQKSNVIVMLNRCFEMEQFAKCEQYWPGSVGHKFVYSNVKLTVTLVGLDEEKHYTQRKLLLEDDETQKSRTILQFQYKAWPDHDQPDSPTSFLRLLSAIRKSGGLDKMDEPTVVHCSAGIGRSGTFCLIDSILSMVENQGTTEGIDIINTLLEMRDYRMGLIQTSVQLRFAYMCILYGIKILEKANKLHPHISSMTPIDKTVSQTNNNNSSRNQNNNSDKTNGTSAQTNGKKQRRNKKTKQTSANNSSSLNVFNKHLLVEALDDIDSDSADNLFEDAMKHLPSLKKARNSGPENFNENLMRQIDQFSKDYISRQNNSIDEDGEQTSTLTKAQRLTDAINYMLTENTISQPNSDSQNTDSALLRRRERELRNQRLAEKTVEIKTRMKAEEMKKEINEQKMAIFKRSAMIGGVAILVSSIAYMYLHGN